MRDGFGTTWTFFGHDANAGNGAGQLWKAEDADWNVTFAEHETNAATAAGAFDASGGPSEVYDASGRRFSYTYTSGRLTEVKAETKTGGTWEAPTGLATVAEVDYEYYATAGTHGSVGDLQTVITSTRLSDTTHISKQYYRYWRDADTAGDDHMVKLVLSAEGVRQYDLLDSTFDDDHLTASDADLFAYASHSFEYGSGGRINSAIYNGECGCSGGTIGQYNFTYENNTGYTDSSGYTQTWKSRTVVERPDGTFSTHYFDELGQPLSQVITDGDPATGGSDTWATYVVRDTAGIVTTVHSPANVTAYDHTLASVDFTRSSSVGLIQDFGLESSGGLRGFLLSRRFREGTSGASNYEKSYSYDAEVLVGTDGEVVRAMVASVNVYPTETTTLESGSNMTTYAYTYYTGTLSHEVVTTINPPVSTGNNGSGFATSSSVHYDSRGRVDFTKSESGSIEYFEYIGDKLTKSIRDADTSKSASGEDFSGVTIPSLPIDFSSSGSPIHSVTEKSFPSPGVIEVVLPGGRVTSRYTSQTKNRLIVQLSYPRVVPGSPATYYGPVGYLVSNLEGKTVVSGTIALSGNSSTTAQASHVDEMDDDIVTVIDELGTLCRLSTTAYDESGGTASESRTYFLIPGSGTGLDGTNYDTTTFAYSGMGKRIRTVEPSGTIRRVTYDAMGRPTQRAIGTNDTGLEESTSTGTSNMVATEALVYDGGNDAGNGFLTERTLYVVDGATDKRVTGYERDLRGNVLLQTNPTAPHIFNKYDNLNRLVASSKHSSKADIVVGTDDPTTESSNRFALNQTEYDQMGRVWRTKRHKIDAGDGSDDDSLTSTNWYDGEGRRVKVEGGALAKVRYDGLGRATHRFTLAVDNDTTYADADDVSGDIVLQEDQVVYDSSSGLPLMRVRIDRLHDDKSAGETTGGLDTNADSDGLLVSAVNVAGRPQITGMWYDSLDRLTDTVRFGTYGGSNFDRNGMSVPARSDTALRSTNTYGTDGSVEEVSDPKALVRRTERDDAGRTIAVIRHYAYDAVAETALPTGGDVNVTVRYEFTDGLRTKFTADLPAGSADQDTIYTYGTTKGTSAGDSRIETGHLLRQVQYPDSSGGTDVVNFAYNVQSQQIWKKDQEGNVFETDFDVSGRQTHMRVTSLDADFDGVVRRVSSTYGNLGRRTAVDQYDNASVGSGSATDGVAFSYDGWGNLIEYEEDRNSAVSSGNDEYDIVYTWQTGELGRNTVRKDTTTLPSGAVLDYDYRSTSGRHDSDVSRVTTIAHGATIVASYQYNGVGQVVETDYLESDVRSQVLSSTSGVYPGWDRFNRVATNKWTAYGGTATDFYSIDLTYDRNSNITVIEDNVHDGFDVSYTMDGIDRLTQAEEGTWGGLGIGSQTRDQQWTLDQVGNWNVDKVDLNGDGDFVDADEVNDDRTHNDANEITARDTDDNGTEDFTLVYDAAGNLTDDGESYKYEYDAFYRLRRVRQQGGKLVAEYRYNGLGHRIAEHVDTDDDADVDMNDDWRYFAYDERWRTVAHFLNSGTAPTEEFVHHAAGVTGRGGSSYVDLVVMRDRDANADGGDGREERMYYCQNWRADVSAIVDDAGELYEWVKYSAYGVPIGLPGADTDSDGDCDATDIAQIQTWIGASTYDARGDVDLDGDVDAKDKSIIRNRLQGTSLGRGVLTAVENRRGVAGYHYLGLGGAYSVRFRVLESKLGTWLGRDPKSFTEGPNVYAYVGSEPIRYIDDSGAARVSVVRVSKSCTVGPWITSLSWANDTVSCVRSIRTSSTETQTDYFIDRSDERARCRLTAATQADYMNRNCETLRDPNTPSFGNGYGSDPDGEVGQPDVPANVEPGSDEWFMGHFPLKTRESVCKAAVEAMKEELDSDCDSRFADGSKTATSSATTVESIMTCTVISKWYLDAKKTSVYSL